MITLKCGCKCTYKHDHGLSNNKKKRREKDEICTFAVTHLKC